ncbi:hypothetical protein PVAND_008058 [Polypedilum vanderplanki]|uniref:SMB domain-containing protein n=1 Tax=Polypedilum vanderplanki TaxID=319348 RepID=A0A9J6C8L3_POLVA|nr:hypothetical protein PVAND_008058 [Polypedilum vanderplanki]
MARSLLILPVFLVALYSCNVNGQYAYFDDFAGQKFCATRERTPEGTCCSNRVDECSVPIAGTLCYCDEFCDKHINPDCCPDYESFCKGAPPPITKVCSIGDIHIRPFEEIKVNCNLCKCSGNSTVTCEEDVCLSDVNVINDINRNAASLGWKAYNYTEFYGKKLKEGLTYRLGTFEPRVKVKSMSRLGHSTEQLPQNFNSLTKWTGFISEIHDQGWCGSSWAVSTASVGSDRISINTKEVVDLASQHLLSCVRHQQGCTGGHLDNAWRYLNRLGVADEDCYPYEATVGRCRAKKNDNLRTMQCNLPSTQRESLYKMGPAYSLNNETDIMWEIFHYGPVQATMWVYPDLFTYRSGIYRKSSFGDQHAKGFHSVRLVGWGEESNGFQRAKYWIAAQSWGKWWGENGFFRIARGNNECGIEEYVLSAMADQHDRKNARRARSHQKTMSRNRA